MRHVTLLAAALAVVPNVLAKGNSKSAIVWFEDDSVPDHVFQEAKAAIEKAGGEITHVYDLIKGFSATGPESAFSEVRVQFEGNEHPMRIDEDEDMGIF